MSKAKSAELILKLYDLRREQKMRDARNWMVAFFPESVQDVMNTMLDAEASAYYRMVTTYWDMAASFVNHGAINEKMFNETSGEAVIVFSKIEPFLDEIRRTMDSPNYLANLEKLIMRMPDAKEMLAKRREMMKRMMQARSEATNNG